MTHNKYLPQLAGVELCTELNVQPSEPETAARCLYLFFYCLNPGGKNSAGESWLVMDRILSAPSQPESTCTAAACLITAAFNTHSHIDS